MTKEIRAPEFTDGMDNAVLSSLYVQLGDYIEEGQTLFDIETDKVTLEVTAPISGYITALHHSVGESLQSSALVTIIEEGEAPIDVHSRATAASPQVIESEVDGKINLKYTGFIVGILVVGALIISIG